MVSEMFTWYFQESVSSESSENGYDKKQHGVKGAADVCDWLSNSETSSY
jgi:hypothetical protein